MSDKEKYFLELLMDELRNNEYVTTTQMSNLTKVPASTVRRYMTKFCELGIVYADGKNRGTRYYKE